MSKDVYFFQIVRSIWRRHAVHLDLDEATCLVFHDFGRNKEFITTLHWFPRRYVFLRVLPVWQWCYERTT